MSGVGKLRIILFAIIAVPVLIVGVAIVAVSGTTEAPAREPAPAEPTYTAEERRRGFHCLSTWDGNHDGLEALIRTELNDPGSMETISTGITPVDADGEHFVRLEFTAKNAYGGRVRHTAYGWVSQATCLATLDWID